jgi:TonB-dependent SusC/RagA subfamily outer membrane receptor
MKKNQLFLTILMLIMTGFIYGQSVIIKGRVTEKGTNDPLPGVNVSIKGSNTGTTTDFDGYYTINVDNPKGKQLLFSFVGYNDYVATLDGTNQTINVQLQESNTKLKEVVVTALGIKKQRKSLTYAAQDVKSEELKRVKQTNPINSLSGKIAGLNITRNASGAGGSVRVILRGDKSINSNQQPLYVIDGIPVSNTPSYYASSTFGDKSGGNRDGGDALSLINPDDIQSVSVLKGASASALYGSAGLNGVIIISTKKGKKGGFKASYSSSFTVENPAYMMKFSSDAQKNIDSFFQSGNTLINSVSLTGGSQAAQTYFSYSNTTATGIMPTNDFSQHTINLKETAQLLENKLTVNAGVMYSRQNIKNRPVSALYYNPLIGVYNFDPGQGNLSDWEKFEEFDSSRNLNAQRWFRATSDIEQNPYWIINRNATEDNNKKMLMNIGASFKFNNFITLQSRGSYDNSVMDYNRKIYATSNGTLSHENGRYILSNNNTTQWYIDLLANINYSFNKDLKLTAVAGTSMKHNLYDTFYADSGNTGGLQYANVFALQNFNASANANINEHHTQKKVSSIFASTTLSYKDFLFFDLTGRNDWSSALPAANRSFFYPSIGVTGILSNMFAMGNKISFAKVRISYAEVGNDVAANFLYPNRNIYFGSGVDPNEPIRPLNTPRPERQKSIEIGTEWRFMNDRIGINIGYYKTNTIDQYLLVNRASSAGGNELVGVNSGDIENKGWEISAFSYPVSKENFKWKAEINFAKNKNTILELSNPDDNLEIPYYTVSPAGPNSFASYIVEGGSFGDIYAQVVKRDENGRPIVDQSGGAVAIQNSATDDNSIAGLQKVGNANPDFTLGLNNHFNIKNFGVDFLIDGHFGGVTMSMTEAVVEGMSDNSLREQDGSIEVVDLSGNISELSNKKYYSAAGGRNGFTGEYIYDATNIRLAELALSYKFNMKKYFKNATVSLIGRNLFFIYKKAPYDPNISGSTGNALQGVDVFNLPSTRSLGLNLNLNF